MRIVIVLSMILLAGLVGAAEKRADGKHGKPQPWDHLSKNGEMERPDEVKAAWADQVAAPATDAAPVIVGAAMWNGRADREYKPFHQWEMILEGGTEPIDGLRFRTIVLGPDMKPLLGKMGTGHWVDLGGLKPGKRVTFSYKLNCSAPTAVRMECRWDGGEASYLTPDPKGLPVREGDPAKEAKLLVLQPDFEYVPKKKLARISFFLRNEGGKPATGVVHTVKLVDHKGKVVHEVEHVPTKDGAVPPGFAEQIRFELKKVPKFDNISVSTKSAESESGGGTALDGGEFTGAKNVEVAHLKIADGALAVDVRNGLDDAVADLVVTLDLLDSAGGLLKTVELPVGRLEPGQEKPLTAEVGDVGPVGGWGVGFSFGTTPAKAEQGPAKEGGTLAPMDIDGVQLQITDIEAVGQAVKLELVITNTKEAALAGLSCELTVKDKAGTTIVIPLDVGDLDAGASFEGAVIGEGVGDVAGVQMGWKTGG